LDALQIFENYCSNIVRNTSIPNETFPVSAVYFDQGSKNILFENNAWDDCVFSPNRDVQYHCDGTLTAGAAFTNFGIYTADTNTPDIIVRKSAGIMDEFSTAKNWDPAPVITNRNVALNRWVSANYENNSYLYNYLAIRGVDNNTNTLWSSGVPTNNVAPYFLIELKRPTRITKIDLVPRATIDQPGARRNFQILFSTNGINWVNFASQGSSPFAYPGVWSQACVDTNKYSYVLLEKTAVEPMNFSELRVFD
jgi:hypothetical protein